MVVDRVTNQRWIFSGTVPEDLIQLWHEGAAEQVICEIEAYALAITLFGLRGFLTGRSVVAFIDNDPCRASDTPLPYP